MEVMNDERTLTQLDHARLEKLILGIGDGTDVMALLYQPEAGGHYDL